MPEPLSSPVVLLAVAVMFAALTFGTDSRPARRKGGSDAGGAAALVAGGRQDDQWEAARSREAARLPGRGRLPGSGGAAVQDGRSAEQWILDPAYQGVLRRKGCGPEAPEQPDNYV